MPKIAGLSLTQIRLEEQEQQPIKQLSIESRHFLLNLQLGGLGSSQQRGQYCNVELLCLRPRRKTPVPCYDSSHQGSITAGDPGSPQRVSVPLLSELGELLLLQALRGGTKANLFLETRPKGHDFVKYDTRQTGRWSTALTRSFLEVSRDL